MLRFLTRRHGLLAQEAEDVAQDTWLIVFEGLRRWKPEARFQTMLFGIVRNRLRNRPRPRPTPGPSPDPPARDSPSREAELKELEARLDKCVQELRPEDQELIRGSLRGESYNQQADRLGISVNDVRNGLHQAREKIRQCVERGNVK